MKYLKFIAIFLLVFSFYSCKKKYDKDIIGPEIISNFKLIEPFELNRKLLDFDSNYLSFKARFSTPVKWKITINGLESCAQKNIVGFSDSIPSSVFWNGSQDSLYYFRTNEECTVVLSVDRSFKPTLVSDNLSNRGDIVANDAVVATDQIKIKNKRKTPKGQIEVFIPYESISDLTKGDVDAKGYERYLSEFNAGYDKELPNEMIDGDVPFFPSGFPVIIYSDKSNVPLSCSGGLRSKDYYMLKGTDRTSNLDNPDPDYYIGRMASINLKDDYNITNIIKANLRDSLFKYNVKEDQLYFNVFIYGNGDGSTVNYTIKEDENGDNKYDDIDDEAYEKAIKVDFIGWKLFSFSYNQFGYTKYKLKNGDDAEGLYHDNKKEPLNIVQIQFGLVAPNKGKSGKAIIENPVISWGGPLKY